MRFEACPRDQPGQLLPALKLALSAMTTVGKRVVPIEPGQPTKQLPLKAQAWITAIDQVKKSGKSTLQVLQKAIQIVPPPPVGSPEIVSYQLLWSHVQKELKGVPNAHQWFSQLKAHDNLVKNAYFYRTWALFLFDEHKTDQAIAVLNIGTQVAALPATELSNTRAILWVPNSPIVDLRSLEMERLKSVPLLKRSKQHFWTKKML